MSVKAISWALNLAQSQPIAGAAVQRVQVRARRLGQPSRAGRHRGVPSVATLIPYIGLPERAARTCLDRLEAAGIIRPCGPDIVAARIKRADRRPKART